MAWVPLQELKVGDQVILSGSYMNEGDAINGPLAPGVVGTVVESDGSGTPYLVRAPNGKKWWYRRNAVAKLMPFGAAPPLSYVPAFRPSPAGSVEIRGTCVFCAFPVLTDQGRTVRETTAGRKYHHMVCCQWIGCCPQPGAVSAGCKKSNRPCPDQRCPSSNQPGSNPRNERHLRGLCSACPDQPDPVGQGNRSGEDIPPHAMPPVDLAGLLHIA